MMMDSNTLLVAYGMMAISLIQLIGLHAILPGGKYSKGGYSALVVVFGVAILYEKFDPDVDRLAVLATSAPLFSYWVVYAIRKYFMRTKGRAPIDTALNFDDGLFADRAYNIVAYIAPFILTCLVFALIYFATSR